MTGAEICLIEGRRGAMIQYIEGGRKIYHYVIPQEGTKPRDPEAASMWASSGSSGGSEGGGVGGPALSSRGRPLKWSRRWSARSQRPA
jgi:hypothetical protein